MESFRPVLLCPLLINRNTSVFYMPDREIEVEVHGGLMRAIVPLCDGVRTVGSIAGELQQQWSVKLIRRVFAALQEYGVAQDSRNVSATIWQFVENPTPWGRDLNDRDVQRLVGNNPLHRTASRAAFRLPTTDRGIMSILRRRRSVRCFTLGAMAPTTLGRLLWSIYGETEPLRINGKQFPIQRRTVPSAGALYPLRVHVVLQQDCGRVSCGVYRVQFGDDAVELKTVRGSEKSAAAMMVDPGNVQNAIGWVVISGAVSRSSRKYANRGFLYTILEAGHAAQNFHLVANQEGYSTLEVGGFLESEAKRVLCLPAEFQPLTTIVFGHSGRPEELPTHPLSDRKLMKPEVHLVPRKAGEYEIPFAMAFARIPESGGTSWSCGRSRSSSHAIVKASAEAIEWFACSRHLHHSLLDSTYTELAQGAVDPRTIVRYLPSQFLNRKVQPFREGDRYQWREVVDTEKGSTHYVLADFVYFPYSAKYGRRYVFANSSGTAAHPKVHEAVQRAVLELIEREAFMITWTNRLVRSRIRRTSMPETIQARIRALEKVGYTVSVTDLTLDLAPVVLVSATNSALLHFTCSAASSVDPSEAVNRALMETEASVYCRLRDGAPRRAIDPDQVWYTEDHAILYNQLPAVRRANFLHGTGTNAVDLHRMVRRELSTFHKILVRLAERGFRVLIADLNERDPLLAEHPLHIVKAIVPGLVPMNFEYGLEALGLERLRGVAARLRLRSCPISVYRMNRYPHPFA